VPARSRSGPLADVSNSVGSRALSLGEIGLVEAPSMSKGPAPSKRQPSQPLPALEPRRSHVLLDMEGLADPGAGSEVALGVRTAAVTSPVTMAPSSSARTARDRPSGAAGGEFAAVGDGFEELDLQENRIGRSGSMIDPGGGSLGGQLQPPRAAPQQTPEPRTAGEEAEEEEDGLHGSQSPAESGSDDGTISFTAELESLRRASDGRPQRTPPD